ncbi:protein FAR-RED IMPAIRED RESPONSE 1-like [Silene latifolia]|uniref:protein FAR-RED IMPAIRED RESPONSE 1-like n=1 Tax=Silene latifolia TaxID=37657 RepID=UPI003D77DC40
MGQKEPQFMITDQCPAIKKAFPYVFKTARHRYCMWHITQKITDKVGSALCRDTDFLARFNAVVWDPDMEPSEFEEKWQKVISDFQLEDNDWLTTMFDDRHHWIPAYHRDLALGCILRTTQRSESTNSFFKRYENHFGTLVEFWMRFQTAMNQQRYTRRCDDYNSDHSFPELKTELPIEKHGAIIYTHAVFKVFQEEVMAADSCGVDDFEKEEHVRIIHVIDAETDRIFKVRFDLRSTDAVCECKLFERIGLLCRHIVWVYKGKGIGRIPSKYIVDQFRQIVGVLKTLPAEHTEELASLLVEFRQKLCIEPLTKYQEMEILLGCSSSSEVTIHPPEQARNKGSEKRLKLAKQQAIEKAAKPKRLCVYCKERVTHDRKTCPLRIADEAAEKEAKKKKV